MSDYIRQNLRRDEKVVLEAKFNKLCFIPKIIGIIFAVALFLGFDTVWNDYLLPLAGGGMPDFIAPIITVALAFPSAIILIANLTGLLSLMSMHLVITDKRILGKVGLFSIKALDYPIEKVDNVSIQAGFFGNIFKYYTLSVQSAGSGMAVGGQMVGGIRFEGIGNAIEFKNCVVAAIEQHAEEARRLQAEEIAKAMSGK